ncbi:hypothetical protein AB5I41_26485 [Sphingomonas sp. MMS24-JH45]
MEASRLTVSGDVSAARTLSFLKPRAVLDWRPGPKWHAQLLLQRTVAQLQFSDFISTAELGTERVNGGNAQLLPQRSWDSLFTLEHPILGDGVVRLEADTIASRRCRTACRCLRASTRPATSATATSGSCARASRRR